MEYTSYERIGAALNHKEADKIPFDFGGTGQTGINVKAYVNLREYLGLPKKEIEIGDTLQQLAKVDQDVLDMFSVDVETVYPGLPDVKGNYEEVTLNGDYYYWGDEWGIKWKMPVGYGLYFDMYKAPLAEIETIDELKGFYIPNGSDPGRFTTMQKDVEACVLDKKRGCIIGRHYAGIFETASWMRGLENFLCDMVVNRSLAEKLLDIVTDNKIAYWAQALKVAGNNPQVLAEADDLATQNSLIVSKEMYREIIKPRHKRLCETVRKAAGRPISFFYHCCGAMKELIPDLIEAGFDIMNPIQVSAKGMDPKELKRLFGKDVTFWGGGCESQHILPNGTVQEVKDEVKRRIDELAPGGGFVFASIHNIQADVPPENIVAMWETFKDNCKYR